MKLQNEDFLRQFYMSWHSDDPAIIEEIENKKEWTFLQEGEYYSLDIDKRIELYGPHGLRLSIDEFKLIIWDPPYRYRQWFGLKNEDGTDAIEHRNYWRQYMLQIITLFDGDRVMYLADNSHPLDKYIDCECSFEETEERLLSAFGHPSSTFKEVTEDFQRRYFIDRFEDLQ